MRSKVNYITYVSKKAMGLSFGQENWANSLSFQSSSPKSKILSLTPGWNRTPSNQSILNWSRRATERSSFWAHLWIPFQPSLRKGNWSHNDYWYRCLCRIRFLIQKILMLLFPTKLLRNFTMCTSAKRLIWRMLLMQLWMYSHLRKVVFLTVRRWPYINSNVLKHLKTTVW